MTSVFLECLIQKLGATPKLATKNVLYLGHKYYRTNHLARRSLSNRANSCGLQVKWDFTHDDMLGPSPESSAHSSNTAERDRNKLPLKRKLNEESAVGMKRFKKSF